MARQKKTIIIAKKILIRFLLKEYIISLNENDPDYEENKHNLTCLYNVIDDLRTTELDFFIKTFSHILDQNPYSKNRLVFFKNVL